MSIFKKDDRKTKSERYYKYMKLDGTEYRMYRDEKDFMSLSLYARSRNGEDEPVGLAVFNGIPVEEVERALIEYKLDEAGSPLMAYKCELKVVPKGDEPQAFDMIGLKQYREKIESLAKAKMGLRDAQRTFGERSAVAQSAEKIVQSLEAELEATQQRLLEGGLSND